MKTIYAVFERVENAKAAVGRCKKESWNQADFVVILPEKPSSKKIGDDRFEFGEELFLNSPDSPNTFQWPALQEQEIEGIGRVKMAISFKPDYSLNTRAESTLINKDLIVDGLKKNKIMTLIEADDAIVSQIETILESEGAEITIFDEKREELQG